MMFVNVELCFVLQHIFPKMLDANTLENLND
jgi:hypothetical protein